MGTVPRVLVWKTASPSHADFGGLSSGTSPVVIRHDVVPLQPRSSALTVAGCRLGGYPAARDRWGGNCSAGGMSEDNDRCFAMLVLGAFSTGVFFNTNALGSFQKPVFTFWETDFARSFALTLARRFARYFTQSGLPKTRRALKHKEKVRQSRWHDAAEGFWLRVSRCAATSPSPHASLVSSALTAANAAVSPASAPGPAFSDPFMCTCVSPGGEFSPSIFHPGIVRGPLPRGG